MDFGRIWGYLGRILQLNALLMLIPLFVAFYYNEDMVPFLVTAAVSFVLGLIFSRFPLHDLDLKEAMALSALTLLTISVIGGIPLLFVFKGSVPHVTVDCFFESVSGYTTTGLTVIPQKLMDSYPKSIHFARAYYQWIGGIGIIIMFLQFFSAPRIRLLYLYRSERGEEHIGASVKNSSREVIKIYLFYTVCGIILLNLCGMPVFDSVFGILSALSTGGFWYTSSQVPYINPLSRLVLMLFMLIGATETYAHRTLFRGKVRDFFGNIQVKGMFAILLVGILLFTLSLAQNGMPILEAIEKSAFNVVSAITTTGFSDIDYHRAGNWGDTVSIILMWIGAATNSTGGGIKIMRFLILLGAIRWIVKRIILPPTAVAPFKLGDSTFQEKEVLMVMGFIAAYFLFLFAGFFVLLIYGYGAIDSLFVSSSALGTSGLSTLDIAALPLFPKIVLALQMLFGRLEIFPFLVLLKVMSDKLGRR